MRTPAEKGNFFRALHERVSAFVIPNLWDAGTARLPAREISEHGTFTFANEAVSYQEISAMFEA